MLGLDAARVNLQTADWLADPGEGCEWDTVGRLAELHLLGLHTLASGHLHRGIVCGHTFAMNDPMIRTAMHKSILREHWRNPTTLVIDEMGICGGFARVDVAVVAEGQLHGYEIKSEMDSLHRLARQIDAYNATMDRVTLVTHERHAEAAKALIPDWWAIKVVTAGPRGGVRFDHYRRGRANPAVNPNALVELLWRDEVVAAMKGKGAPKSALSLPKYKLYDLLVQSVTMPELGRLVRSALRGRTDWRPLRNPMPQSPAGLPV